MIYLSIDLLESASKGLVRPRYPVYDWRNGYEDYV